MASPVERELRSGSRPQAGPRTADRWDPALHLAAHSASAAPLIGPGLLQPAIADLARSLRRGFPNGLVLLLDQRRRRRAMPAKRISRVRCITSFGPQGLVARTHRKHDGCFGTGIWGISAGAMLYEAAWRRSALQHPWAAARKGQQWSVYLIGPSRSYSFALRCSLV
jgi:hypothetical protein